MRNRKYTIEQLNLEAAKYKSRQEFKKGSSKEYGAAHNYKVIDEITKHMIPTHPLLCSKCNTTKTLEEFTKNSKCVEGRSGICILCRNKDQNKRAANNPNIKAIRTKNSKKARNINKDKILEHLGGKLKCKDCGFTHESQAIFDFHHLDPTTKTYTVSSILDYTWKTIKIEIDKCVLLCANCHRIRHHKEKENENN